MSDENKVENIDDDNLSHEKVNGTSTSHVFKDFDISEKFLQSMFKYDEEAGGKVWKVDSHELPALVQVVRTSKEKHDSKAFSICDGSGYLWNSCFISRDKDVTLNSVIEITHLENVKTEDYDKDDYLERDSVFDDVLAIAEFEVVCKGIEIGHCLWDLQSVQQIYVLSSGALDCKESQFDILNNKDLWDTTSVPEKCDVRFEFKDGQVLHAHKHVLKEKSSVFEAHFDDERVFADQKLVKITDANCRTFTKFLRWIYGFNIQFDSLETMFELVYLSDKYIVGEFLPILRNKVRETLEQRPQQAVAASNLNSTGDAAIADIIFSVIDKHIDMLCRTGEMMKWDNDTIEMVTARESLNIDEYQLLQYLFIWVQKHAQNKDQLLSMLNNIKFEEIHKSALKNFLESDIVKDVEEKNLLDRSQLENHISLRVFKNTSSLEKRVLFNQDITNYSTYRSIKHFTSDDDPSTFLPVIFPLTLTPACLTSLPMVILNDDFTLIQPNVLLKSLGGGEYSLECVIRLNGAVSGLPDMSVFRQADYFRHVSDIQAKVELHYSTATGWEKQEQDLTQRGLIRFKMMDVSLIKGVLSQDEVFRGCLVVRQYKSQESSFNTSNKGNLREKLDTELSSSESEPEGEDVGYDDDENDQDEEEDEEELDDFIQDEEEFSAEEEEAPENVQNGQDSEVSENEEASDENKEASFSSDEEVVKKPRYQNRKEKNRRKLSSENEEPRTKKRRRVIVDSESEEEEERRKVNREKNADSESEESEYETDDEMGKQTETDNPNTPEAGFSGEDQPTNSDADTGVNKENEVGFSTDEEDTNQEASTKENVVDEPVLVCENNSPGNVEIDKDKTAPCDQT